jgi:ABC-type amino acid transport system permease subunit
MHLLPKPCVACQHAMIDECPNCAPRKRFVRKGIALGLWFGADALEIVRGGLLAAAVALLGES